MEGVESSMEGWKQAPAGESRAQNAAGWDGRCGLPGRAVHVFGHTRGEASWETPGEVPGA